jgi:excisionase family DNA binding protein
MTQQLSPSARPYLGTNGNGPGQMRINGSGRDHVADQRTEEASDPLGLMTPAEVAAILHVDANTVARWANGGKLRAVRTPGGHRRYYATEVLRLARRGRD